MRRDDFDDDPYMEDDYRDDAWEDSYEADTVQHRGGRRNGGSGKTGWVIILVIGILMVLAALSWLGYRFYMDYKASQVTEEIQEIAEAIPEPVEEPEEEEEPVILPDNPIDFEALWEQNEEIYAWIRIEDTLIDYPILQSETDDGFYLDHDVEKNYSSAGSIYSEAINAKDFTDPVTVLYGHNMKSGKMFQNLHKFEDQTFFDEHEFFHVYIPGHDLTYRVFAMFNYDNRHIMNSFYFDDPEVFMQFVNDIFNKYRYSGHVREDVEIEEEDRILIMSTCIANRPDLRCLVTAVLTEDQETKPPAEGSNSETETGREETDPAKTEAEETQ